MALKEGHLRYFVTVAEEGQITIAAEKLHLTQPALSQAIAELEDDLDLRLFERHARGVRLTHAGGVFLEKARAALTATEDILLTAEALARIDRRVITCGYLGLEPALTNPELIEAFAQEHAGVEIVAEELPYPSLPTASWLRGVDVAICSNPAGDPNVAWQPLHGEQRVVMAPKRHRLAQRESLSVADVLDETFLGFHRSIDPAWAGFWSLDDHRGGPAPRTFGHAINAQERFGALATGRGISVVPACHAAVIVEILRGVVAIPLSDAAPAILTLVARKGHESPLVRALFATARKLTPRAAALSLLPND
jgi:DNA-binding transcriptional LysR family regulator